MIETFHAVPLVPAHRLSGRDHASKQRANEIKKLPLAAIDHDASMKLSNVDDWPFRLLSGMRIMDGEPDRRMILARPFDAVFQMCRDQNIVAGRQNSDPGFAFKTKPRRSGQDDNPFGPRLIVPEPWRTSLAQRRRSVRFSDWAYQGGVRQFLAPIASSRRQTDCRMRLASTSDRLRHWRPHRDFVSRPTRAPLRPIVMDKNSGKHRHGEDVGRHETKRKGGDRRPGAKSAHAPANAEDCRAGNERHVDICV